MSVQKPKLAIQLDRLTYLITFVVLLLVVFMRRIHIESSLDFSFLPAIYSILNGITAIILIYAYIQIRNKKVELHKRAMIIAIATSLLFLLMYVLYHITTPETPFCKTGFIRQVYFFLLISHIVLAAVSFPFILFTFVRGYTNMITEHRKFAKKVFPVWLYVAITGPVIYLLLFPCYS